MVDYVHELVVLTPLHTWYYSQHMMPTKNPGAESISSNNPRIDVVQLRKLTRVILSQKDHYII